MSLFPEHIRPGFRPMKPEHESYLKTALEASREVIIVDDDKSLGAVVVARNNGSPVVAMISPKTSTSALYWVFPKGHPYSGESDVEGAIREVREETGIDVSAAIFADFFYDESYTFVGRLHADRWSKHSAFPDESLRPAAIAHKSVRFYLAVIEEPAQFAIQEAEVADAKWVPIEDVHLPQEEAQANLERFLNGPEVCAIIGRTIS